MASGDLLNNRLGCQWPLVSNLCRGFGNGCLRLEYFLANTFNHLLDGFLIQNRDCKTKFPTPEREVVIPGLGGWGGRFWNSPEPAGSHPAYLSF